MQGQPTSSRAWSVRRNSALLIVLVLFLLLGAGIGYLVARTAISEATLDIRVENEGNIDQTVRVLVNDGEVAVLEIPPGQIATFAYRVGWAVTTRGMYEVRAEPSFGAPDTERVTVTNGGTFLVELRVG